jgi:hypothetical protein
MESSMGAYLYPTHPDGEWLEKARNKWKESGRPYFSLWFLRVIPRQLVAREANGHPFWMYMYYSLAKTTGCLLSSASRYTNDLV